MKDGTKIIASASDRRSGQDRRKREAEPPSGWERRRGVEPRRPEVVELELTPSQWDALHDHVATSPSPLSDKA